MVSKIGDGFELLRCCVSCHGTQTKGGGNEGGCLALMNVFQLFEVDLFPLALQVDDLSGNEFLAAGGAGDLPDKIRLGKAFGGRGIGSEFECQGEEGVTGENCQSFAKDFVGGGLAAAQIVIVHTGQVIMDQGVGMDTLYRGRQRHGGGRMAFESFVGGQDEDWPEAFASRKKTVAHGLMDKGRLFPGRRYQLIECPLKFLLLLTPKVLKILHDRSFSPCLLLGKHGLPHNGLVRITFLILFGIWISETGLESASAEVVPVFTVESSEFPLQVRSRDGAINRRILEAAEDTLNSFEEALGLQDWNGYSVRVRWRPGSEPTVPVFSYIRNLTISNGTLAINIEAEGPMQTPLVELRRTLIITLLQALAWKGEDQIQFATLNDPPLWLSEGILWEGLSYRDEEWRRIVARAVRIGNVPRLEEIQEWRQLPGLKLERFWRQAFCSTLFRKAVTNPGERQALRLWLKKQRLPAPPPFWEKTPGAETWWQEEVAQPLAPRLPLLDWETTVASLNELRAFSLRVGSEQERTLLKLDALPRNIQVTSSREEVIEILKNFDRLSVKAHFAWKPIVSGYRQAFYEWLQVEYEAYEQRIEALEVAEASLISRKQKAEDMLDWAVVNLDFGRPPGNLDSTLALFRVLQKEKEVFRERERSGDHGAPK